jgi:hypothetical protein
MRRLLIALVLAATSLAGCSCEDETNEGQSACVSDADCDGGTCVAGKCQEAVAPDGSSGSDAGICLATGDTCVAGAAPYCCSGVCVASASGGSVCGAETLCQPNDTACAEPTDCCSLTCTNGRCSDQACVQISSPCADPSECCSGRCESGACAAIPGATCGTLGEACTDDFGCCSRNCQGGLCARASGCSSAGDICYEALDCCNGSCQLPAGGGPGTCAGSVSASGSPNCGVGGEPCGGETDCCSRVCTDLGSGQATCVLGSGCRQTGEVCSKNDDCCGWDTSRVVCSLFSTDPPVGRCTNGTSCQPVGNCCGLFGSSCSQDCCDGKKAVCRLDTGGLSRCFGGGSTQCPNGYDGLDPDCCIPEGVECQFRDQCCDMAPCVQVNGHYVCQSPQCVASGQPCVRGSTGAGACCNGLECLSSGEVGGYLCRTPPTYPGDADAGVGPDGGAADAGPACLANGSGCAANGDCCSGACLSGTCGTCKADGAQCTSGSECCTGLCSAGQCVAPLTCVNEGGTCSGTSECCPGATCVIAAGQANGTCQLGATCSASGQICSTTQACCQGLRCASTAAGAPSCTATDPQCTCRVVIN